MQPLTPTQQAQARHHSYQLFGRLFRQPITADLLPYLQSIPALAAALPNPFNSDQAAAVHHQLFAYNLYPYAAIFLDPSRLLGGSITNEMAAVYQQAGFRADSAVEPDHLGQTFAFLAFLSGQEATAAPDTEQSTAAVHQQQRQFLKSQLLPWLIPCVIAIQAQEDAFYSQLAQLALALVADHYLALKTADPIPTSIPLPLAAEQPVLEDGRTGLRDIARYLITPSQSGLYLGRADINQLARTVSLPHGFGSREQMLRTLLEASGQYQNSPDLFDALQNLTKQWQTSYEEISNQHPVTTVFIAPWQIRLQASQTLLTNMAAQLTSS